MINNTVTFVNFVMNICFQAVLDISVDSVLWCKMQITWVRFILLLSLTINIFIIIIIINTIMIIKRMVRREHVALLLDVLLDSVHSDATPQVFLKLSNLPWVTESLQNLETTSDFWNLRLSRHLIRKTNWQKRQKKN